MKLTSVAVPRTGSAEIKNEYYPTSRLKIVREMRGSIPDSMSRTYYESGNLMSEGEYKDGSLNGTVTIYYENGVTKQLETYENGRKIKIKIFDPKGHLKAGPQYP